MTDLYRNLDISTRAMMKRQEKKEERKHSAVRDSFGWNGCSASFSRKPHEDLRGVPGSPAK